MKKKILPLLLGLVIITASASTALAWGHGGHNRGGWNHGNYGNTGYHNGYAYNGQYRGGPCWGPAAAPGPQHMYYQQQQQQQPYREPMPEPRQQRFERENELGR